MFFRIKLSSKYTSVLVAQLFLFFLTACPKPLPEVHSAKYAPPIQDKQKMISDQQAGMKMAEDHQQVLNKQVSDKKINPPDYKNVFTLTELVETGLKNNPETRAAWMQARASAAKWGRARSDYYPTLDGSVDAVAGEIPQLQGGRSYVNTSVQLQYLLLDFGGRGAKSEAARQALLVANWSHNQAIRDLLRDIPRAYYELLSNKAKVKASKKSLVEAQTVLNSTEKRFDSGVSTISDVLKARVSVAQADLNLISDQGDVKKSRGILASAIGWPANAYIAVEDNQTSLPVHKINSNVDMLIAQSKTRRSDLVAAKARVRQKQAQLLQAEAAPYPKLNAMGNLNWQKMRNSDNLGAYGGLKIEIPIFHGFDMQNAVKAARAELETARADLKKEEVEVVQQVWDSYHDFKTALGRLKASDTMLSSSKESYEASLNRYRVGSADIVELLDAQSSLAAARSQVIDSRMQVFISYAELIHAAGLEDEYGMEGS